MVIGNRGHAPPVPPLPGEHVAGPGKDVVRGIQGQRAPAVADASSLLEGTKGVFTRPLPLRPEGRRRERRLGRW